MSMLLLLLGSCDPGIGVGVRLRAEKVMSNTARVNVMASLDSLGSCVHVHCLTGEVRSERTVFPDTSRPKVVVHPRRYSKAVTIRLEFGDTGMVVFDPYLIHKAKGKAESTTLFVNASSDGGEPVACRSARRSGWRKKTNVGASFLDKLHAACAPCTRRMEIRKQTQSMDGW